VRPETSRYAAYVIEQYVPGLAGTDVEASVSALRRAVAVERASLRLACSLLIGDDELCLHVLLAPSAERAATVAGAAAITAERIVAATAWLGR
jgi:hypothetical protein